MAAGAEILLVAEALLDQEDEAAIGAHLIGAILAYSLRHGLTPHAAAEAMFKALPADDDWPELRDELELATGAG